MDEEDQDHDTSSFVCARSPVFSKEEAKALVNLVSKYKNIILNKCTNSTTNHAKEATWIKICKEINQKGFKHKRTVDSLKIKWENLKKEARKLSKNLIDVKCSDLSNILTQIVVLINEAETITVVNSNPEVPQDDILNTIHGMVEEIDNNFSNTWDDANNESDESTDDGDVKERGSTKFSRSLNFSPQECSLLLKCVREQKDTIFNKEFTGRAIKLKNKAWSRITNNYNKQSPQKRSTKVLRTKFNNMKRMARRVNFKHFFSNNHHEALVDECDKESKYEPLLECKQDRDTYYDDTDDDHQDFQVNCTSASKQNEDTSDPLSTVLNGDSGIDSLSHFGSCYEFNNKEVVKLKLELLKYQMENAKLERQRIQDAIQAEASERQSRALQTSLQLRAARLNAIAAQSKLPQNHPALQYTEPETPAQDYLQQFGHT